MLHIFKKKNKTEAFNAIDTSDDSIYAIADGHMCAIETVDDPVFSQKMIGDGVAFRFDAEEITICSPATGILSVLFPTGHAFGVTMKNGVELLVHIGIDTVNSNGTGFESAFHKQGDSVRAGDPIVKVDLAKLRNQYDMSTMLIVCNANNKKITFSGLGAVKRGQLIAGEN